MLTFIEKTTRLWKDSCGEGIVTATAGEHYATLHRIPNGSQSAKDLREIGEAFLQAADFLEQTKPLKQLSSMDEAEKLVRRLFEEHPILHFTAKGTREAIEGNYDTKIATSTCSRLLAELKKRGILQRYKKDCQFVYHVPKGPGL